MGNSIADEMTTGDDWKKRVGNKLTPEEAVSLIKSGDRVVIGMMHATPLQLCRALAARQAELENVQIDASLSTFGKWWSDEREHCFTIESFFLVERDRAPFNRGLIEYRIAPPYRNDESRWTLSSIDVFMTQATAPDEDGWCSFGLSDWGARRAATRAKIVLAEVNPAQVRTGGDNASTWMRWIASSRPPRLAVVAATAAKRGRGADRPGDLLACSRGGDSGRGYVSARHGQDPACTRLHRPGRGGVGGNEATGAALRRDRSRCW